MGYAWNHYLYAPILNVLMYLYENFAGNNFGWAVVELTILLRIVLLPLSILSERNAAKHERLEHKIAAITRSAAGDGVARRQKIRALLTRERVSPWAKVASFGLQALVLVLLYQVFLGGMNYTKLNVLYSWVDQPDYINLIFFGFDVGKRNLWWPLIVGAVLFMEITIAYRRRNDITASDQLYRVIFPLASAGILYSLPMVKCIFILTSMLFGFILSLFRGLFAPAVSEPIPVQDA